MAKFALLLVLSGEQKRPAPVATGVEKFDFKS